MATWIRADMDFGVPYKRFVLNFRSVVGQEFYHTIKAIGELSTNAEEWAIAVLAVLRNFRPHYALQDYALTVTDITIDPYRNSWVFGVICPQFPRLMNGMSAELENLELCPVCKKPMPTGNAVPQTTYQRLRTVSNGNAVNKIEEEVCSEACFNKKE